MASVTVDGPVAPGTDFDPDDIAEHYWQLHVQQPHLWDREVLHAGRSPDRVRPMERRPCAEAGADDAGGARQPISDTLAQVPER
ncbi:hypothetical protein [Streptomyces flaveolus]|uniref:hypothetical protein n=1 Tax=Streptomyces flaveolus TaxID=67297 RepID=UPI003F4E36B4